MKRRPFMMACCALCAAGAWTQRAQAAGAPARLRFADFYLGPTYQDGVGMAPDLVLTPRVRELHARQVEIVGFMDGILPRDGMHFMLIKEPSFLCPFHTVSFDWAGFAAVFVRRPVEYVDGPITVTGRLDVGKKTDEMGLLSYVRIYDAQVQRIR
jgi:hypothetical protein